MTAPRYQDVDSHEIPEVNDDDGTGVKIIVGRSWGQRGSVDGIAADPLYLDVCRQARTECGSCWSPELQSGSPSRGKVRS